MALARLSGGPLDGQALPLDDPAQDALVLPYGEGQIVYRRQGEPTGTGQGDGPTTSLFVYTEETQEVLPGDD